ncbi:MULTISPECIES: bifunctional 2-polyprenyl-6-hydroxyphenol methylase/3-demethylubiquinol 3-O-methyltransferase UbiG [Bosea]|uniref:class I SAM-dependent methyltransferase n=1 Tax=Bosea TaxID=85413 RepID=UPI00214F832E|nr:MULTISPECIES: class I SAM-dependent methyltransferase [Bosea]MCR4521154.1 class I SAM-dependent methyltransferase [Bosea sp. 47.2.35]MDR6830888.1 ubiquinone/menaquinone biosynthesis C-methylase UbiE [Bosea robiniae]MDR6897672.1 ubiquinone/menaquinone biosynthesis C-methylase UbiE [Bosea sp. BE109]MDR7141069.1 ubiquinone/menaquinone biosynthesis C-methylase UbiE [Bosea sp. BE168]MDR7177621.1 ubiquinone/menaquinone biosynthesis C-methylase UbiE [Bosea sp. BE271]
MSSANDARFWDRTSGRYARSTISDIAGYERTLERTRALLKSQDRVLELGCGTGSTALRLAGCVQSYLATDISTGMIAIAEQKLATEAIPGLSFRAATAEALAPEAGFDAVLGFSYLHLVRDLPGTLRHIRGLLAEDGLFISKTPCIGDMNPLVGYAALPVMRALRLAPYAAVFSAAELKERVSAAGFQILTTEGHATKGKDWRPYIVARKT